MSCLIKKGQVYSPESTVSSLLENCSLNRNSDSFNSHSPIHYKDKLYRSASQALEAYIEDFDLSLASPDIRPGKISISQCTPKDFRSSRDSFSHKYALRNLKQHAILGSVAPHLRRKNAHEPDILSLTTDDLLAFPADGSVPFTRIAALRPATKNNNIARKSLTASTAYAHHWTSSFGNKEELNFPENLAVSTSSKDSSRKVRTQHKFHKYDSGLSAKEQVIEHENLESVLHKNYPRWLTSQKSDLGISEISSIPDFKYPIWLTSHNLLSDSSNESSTQAPAGESHPGDRSNTFGSSGHSGVLDLQHKHSSQTNCQYEIPSVCFAAQDLREYKHLFRDGDELLLQKVRRTLESSAEELTKVLKNDGSPCTVDVLEAERSWDNVPFGLKSPVPVCCEEEENALQCPKASIVNGFLEDCLKNDRPESTFSGGNHHGPVEALKLMLFNLQAVQHSFNQNKTPGQKEEFKKTLDEELEFKLCGHDVIPVRKSLQRALHHLSRLKGLVEDPGGKEESKEFIKT
ncbi:lung adenoma susceptibility protein 2 [Elgaria multicarinata webbii]|uniref:lung adenoma susceptibility protein 2 n=1 Tax=Elgaria multicarinata webbii TaxID=159646 RepID=UPI002FCD2E1A